MGRWAQRTRRGGGPAAAACIGIDNISWDGITTGFVAFTEAVDAFDFVGANTVWIDDVLGGLFFATGVNDNVVTCSIVGSVADGDSISYFNPPPAGICFPQSSPLTE